MKQTDRYDDIIHLPHHQSETRPQMTIYNRAAQFAPFAALTGYEDQVAETSRLTERHVQLSEEEKQLLNEKIRFILENIHKRQEYAFTCFVPDLHKDGGTYRIIYGSVKKIHLPSRTLTLYDKNGISDGKNLSLDHIVEIGGDCFNQML